MTGALLKSVTLTAAIAASSAMGQDIDVPGVVPWDASEPTPDSGVMLQQIFADGTPVADFEQMISAQGFVMMSDQQGTSFSDIDGPRFATRGMFRLAQNCSTQLLLVWTQENGQVFDLMGRTVKRCR